MTRSFILTAALAFLVGCGDNAAQNTPVASNNSDTSVTMSRPADEPTGPVTMKDFSTQAGLKMYPGSESSKGDGFKRADGVIKDTITFSTKDKVEKIAEFYKGEGMDVKNPAMPIGATKSGAQVMVMVSAGKVGMNNVKITGLIEPKKTP
jgi:hypothetical protein